MTTRRLSCLAVLTVAVLLASGSAAGSLELDLGRGPVIVHFPDDNDADRPAPLLILLHGFTGSGSGQEAYMQLLPVTRRAGFIYAYPDGSENPDGNQFWNATPACCDFYRSGVDDSGYLLSLVAEIRSQLAVDPWRVHFGGHSNGGFMSYRMACDHADVLASIGGLAGATYADPDDCDPAGPMHVLQIHGTADDTILYDGGSIFGVPYPGAVGSTEIWAGYGDCSLTADDTAPPRDLDAGIPGAESTVLRYRDGCEPGSSAELWTIPAGGHVPPIADGFREGLVEHARTHRKSATVFAGEQELRWPPLRWAEEYLVYRGLISRLVDEDGDGRPDGGYGDCISATDPDATDTSLLVTDDPPAGDGWFYLVGFREAGGAESILGTSSSGRARRPAAACP